jgi:hypothetical protein
MSANGRDQVKSNTAFTISARVRSDFPIFSIACGWARNGDVEIIFDMVSTIDGATSEFKVRFQAARQSLQSQTADTRHSSLDVDGQVCPRCVSSSGPQRTSAMANVRFLFHLGEGHRYRSV